MVITLGCPKNEVDSDHIKGELLSFGYNLVSNPKIADVIIINTCGFIEFAKRESIETILEYACYKKEGICKVLIVVGCLVQRYPDELFKEIPEIDILLGVNNLSKIPEEINEFTSGKRLVEVSKPLAYVKEELKRIEPLLPYAYLKISDGCNNKCTYCAIPSIKGNYQSLPINKLVEEAKFLASKGVKEIILVGQDTSDYGVDIYGERKLPELILKLSKIEQLDWIRLIYIQPSGFSEELLAVMANNPKVCHYIDLPFQHSSKKILNIMGRKGSVDDYLDLIKKIRGHLPNLVIRSSLIVGFPGESDKDFEELLDFTKLAQLDYIGVFEFSAEEGTKAATLPSQVSNKIKRERYHQLTTLQDSIAFEKNRRHQGQEMKVLIESFESDAVFLGRNQYQSPDIDGLVYIKNNKEKTLKTGTFASAKIVGVDGYDLVGEVEC